MRGEYRIDNYYAAKNDIKPPPAHLRSIESPLSDKRFKLENWTRKYAAQQAVDNPKKTIFRPNRKDNQDNRHLSTSLNEQFNEINLKYLQVKRSGPNQEQSYRGKGIGFAAKLVRPSSNNRERDIQQKNHILTGSQSQGELLRKDIDKLSPKAQTSTAQIKVRDCGKRAELSQYQKLHEKLNALENKIAAMKMNLEKKKIQKESAVERDRKDKKARQVAREPEHKEDQNRVQKAAKVSKEKQKGENALKEIVTQVPKQNKDLHNFDHNPYSPRHNMYYVSEIVKAYKQQKSIARQHLLTSIQLLKIMERVKKNSYGGNAMKTLNLEQKPMYKGKKTIVFDLDQTLIHCNQSTSIPYDVVLPIKFPTGEVIDAGINIRPHAVDLLKSLSANFQIIVFTASHSCYANVVLDYLDPEKKYIQHRLFREHCFLTAEGMHIKDLRVINRKQTQMVLIDNAAYSYAFQLDNGIPIIPYYEGKNDYELKALQAYIQRLVWVADVRDVNKKIFKLHLYRNYDDPEKLVKELYNEWIF